MFFFMRIDDYAIFNCSVYIYKVNMKYTWHRAEVVSPSSVEQSSWRSRGLQGTVIL